MRTLPKPWTVSEERDACRSLASARKACNKQAIERIEREFVERNLRLAAMFADRSVGRGLDIEDLMQEASFGLILAAQRFDPSRGIRFCTYAGWWIRQALNRAVSNLARQIRVPVHVLDARARVARARERLLAEQFGREPSVEEVARVARVSPGLAKAVDGLLQPVSLDAQFDGEGLTLHETIASESLDALDAVIAAEQAAEVRRAVETLPALERFVVERRFGDHEETLEVVAEALGCSREHVRHVERRAVDELRARVEP